MSINALGFALVMGVLFALGDWAAMALASRRSPVTGIVTWLVLVGLPAVLLCVLSWKVAGVALLVSLALSGAASYRKTRHLRRRAYPFAPAPVLHSRS